MNQCWLLVAIALLSWQCWGIRMDTRDGGGSLVPDRGNCEMSTMRVERISAAPTGLDGKDMGFVSPEQALWHLGLSNGLKRVALERSSTARRVSTNFDGTVTVDIDPSAIPVIPEAEIVAASGTFLSPMQVVEVGSHHLSCWDQRNTQAILGVPGGDLAEFIAGLSALESISPLSDAFNQEHVDSFLQDYVFNRGVLYMHSDVATMAAWATVARVSDPLSLDLSDEEKGRVISTAPDFIGCEHITLMLAYPAQYKVRRLLVVYVIRAALRVLLDKQHPLQPKVIYEVLRGSMDDVSFIPDAIVNVVAPPDGDTSTLSNPSSLPSPTPPDPIFSSPTRLQTANQRRSTYTSSVADRSAAAAAAASAAAKPLTASAVASASYPTSFFPASSEGTIVGTRVPFLVNPVTDTGPPASPLNIAFTRISPPTSFLNPGPLPVWPLSQPQDTVFTPPGYAASQAAPESPYVPSASLPATLLPPMRRLLSNDPTLTPSSLLSPLDSSISVAQSAGPAAARSSFLSPYDDTALPPLFENAVDRLLSIGNPPRSGFPSEAPPTNPPPVALITDPPISVGPLPGDSLFGSLDREQGLYHFPPFRQPPPLALQYATQVAPQISDDASAASQPGSQAPASAQQRVSVVSNLVRQQGGVGGRGNRGETLFEESHPGCSTKAPLLVPHRSLTPQQLATTLLATAMGDDDEGVNGESPEELLQGIVQRRQYAIAYKSPVSNADNSASNVLLYHASAAATSRRLFVRYLARAQRKEADTDWQSQLLAAIENITSTQMGLTQDFLSRLYRSTIRRLIAAADAADAADASQASGSSTSTSSPAQDDEGAVDETWVIPTYVASFGAK